MEKIFLLEDDATLSRGISMALSGPECAVILADCLTQAQEKLAGPSYDLLILDINLPDGSGLDLLRKLRDQGNETPTILLTANDLELDEVTGLEAGADDYITKPFSLAVLRARVHAQLRRGSRPASAKLEVGPFVFDFDKCCIAGMILKSIFPKRNRNCCGYWWKIGAMWCPDPHWWTGYGRTVLNL